jgi:uncharacterized protein YcbX
VRLVTTGTLAHLRTIAPGPDWDARRFRPNLLLDDGQTPGGFGEDELLGGRLRGRSGLELTVAVPTPRCVVPTRAHEELPADPRILRMLIEHHRVDLGPLGRQGCVGAYAEVANVGRVEVGERLVIEPGEESRVEAVRSALARVLGLADG